MSKDKSELFLYYWNLLYGVNIIQPIPEWPFSRHIGRRYRFDWAFLNARVAVEIEGNAWGVAGGGRHMQNSDLEKYNLAVSMGWRVFRFSPAMLKNDPQKCIQMVYDAL